MQVCVLKELYDSPETVVKTKHTTQLNGYDLYDFEEPVMVSYENFQEALMFSEETKPDLTWEEFKNEYEKTACSDWGRIDENGNSFGGYWAQSKEELNGKYPYDLTREENAKLLFQLPYKKKLLIWTIRMGCPSRQECVRFSNFLCYWIDQKVRKMYEVFLTRLN